MKKPKTRKIIGIILILILSTAFVAYSLNDDGPFYCYTVLMGDGDCENITLIVPVPFYEGEVYSEIITDPDSVLDGTGNKKSIADDSSISYNIADTEHGKMLQVYTTDNTGIALIKDTGHSPINATPWITGNEPLLSKSDRTSAIRNLKPPYSLGVTYGTPVYASFESKTNASLQVLVQFWAGYGIKYLENDSDKIEIAYMDEIVYTIPHNTSGEWVWVNGSTYSLK